MLYQTAKDFHVSLHVWAQFFFQPRLPCYTDNELRQQASSIFWILFVCWMSITSFPFVPCPSIFNFTRFTYWINLANVDSHASIRALVYIQTNISVLQQLITITAAMNVNSYTCVWQVNTAAVTTPVSFSFVVMLSLYICVYIRAAIKQENRFLVLL